MASGLLTLLGWFEMPELHQQQQVIGDLQRSADDERPGPI